MRPGLAGLLGTFIEADVGMALESNAASAIAPILRIAQRTCARASFLLIAGASF